MRVVGIAGSLRKDSYNKQLLNYAAKIAAKLGERMEIVDIAPLPVLNQDDEVPNPPEPVIKFRDRLSQADAIVICTPEYNYAIPGGLKNAIDWASRPPKNVWDSAVVSIMGATPGPGGTTHSQRDVRHILGMLNATIVVQPLVMVSRAHEAFDSDGNLKDEKLQQNVEKQLTKLFDTARKLKGLA